MNRALYVIVLSFTMSQGVLADEVMPIAAGGPPGRSTMEGPFLSTPSLVKAEGIELPLFKAATEPKGDKPEIIRPLQIGFSRRNALKTLTESAKATGRSWVSIGDKQVTVIRLKSSGASALRASVTLGSVPLGLTVAVGTTSEWERGGSGIVLSDRWIRDTYGESEVTLWTPVTEGDEQILEFRLPIGIPTGQLALSLDDVSHITSPLHSGGPSSKVLTCHQNFSCATDPNVVQSGKAVAKIVYTGSGGGTYLCTGALLNDRSNSRTPYFATANHCISTSAQASSAQMFWFYEQLCGTSVIASDYTTSLGAQTLFTARDLDFTLLRLTGGIPGGVIFLGWNTADLGVGESVYGIHHPAGFPKAFSVGSFAEARASYSFRGQSLAETWNISANIVNWSAGITEGGSSGSPLLTGAGIFRGALSAGPINQSCVSSPRYTAYSRFALIYPRIRSFIDPPPPAPDEANSATGTFASQANDYLTTSISGRLNVAGDEDWFRFTIPQRGVWIVYTTADGTNPSTDTIGRFFAADGLTDTGVGDDDGSVRAPNFYMAAHANPGRYFVRVTGKGASVGPYVLVSVFVADDDHSNFFQLATPIGLNGDAVGAISYGGDSDTFAIDVTTSGILRVASGGGTDVVGFLYDSAFRQVAYNDDVAYPTNLNFALSATVTPGRYYLDVIGYDIDVVGPYSIRTTFEPSAVSSVNRTALWWNPTESGWGINLVHQGDIIFATLFTYDAAGRPMWLFMSNGAKQPGVDTYSGKLYRATGPVFYANPFTPITAANLTEVGTMSLLFTNSDVATLTYSVSGSSVTKSIQRQVFGSRAANCIPTTGSRTALSNYQDLWWNPSESGWGVNITHQDNTLFATLFTYDAGGRDIWFFMSGGVRQPDGSYLGDLYMATGPAFNAQPFTPITTANLTKVGSMQFRFSSGTNGTLTYSVNGANVTKQITRQIFSSPVPSCS